MCDVLVFRSARAGQVKSPERAVDDLARDVKVQLSLAGRLGFAAQTGSRVLDLGCGMGRTVDLLVSWGFDAYGVDVGEWWGKDFDAYWADSPRPTDAIRRRLHQTSEENYRLPFPDDYFDLVISSQVFEHVSDLEAVFSELRRVTKPSGTSVHIFPGRGTPVEPHVGIPFIPLSKSDWWLALWSLFRRRHRSTWAGEFRYLREAMKSNFYPSRAQLRRAAGKADLRLDFREDLYVELAVGSRPWKLRRQLPFLAPVVHRICQRAMVLSRI